MAVVIVMEVMVFVRIETLSKADSHDPLPLAGQTLFRRRIPMTTSILKMKNATKTTKVTNEAKRTMTIQRAAILLKQVSDPTRLQVVTLLSEGERHVGGLCDEFNMSPPALSHHLALLRTGES